MIVVVVVVVNDATAKKETDYRIYVQLSYDGKEIFASY